jgi:hypothetical protein
MQAVLALAAPGLPAARGGRRRGSDGSRCARPHRRGYSRHPMGRDPGLRPASRPTPAGQRLLVRRLLPRPRTPARHVQHQGLRRLRRTQRPRTRPEGARDHDYYRPSEAGAQVRILPGALRLQFLLSHLSYLADLTGSWTQSWHELNPRYPPRRAPSAYRDSPRRRRLAISTGDAHCTRPGALDSTANTGLAPRELQAAAVPASASRRY